MLLKQRLDFPVVEKIQTMDRLAIIQGQKIVEKTVGFTRKKKMALWIDRL